MFGDNIPSSCTPDFVPVAVGLAANPNWPFSNSCKTRSRAAALTLAFSSSASLFSCSSLSFCRFMSFFCVTKTYMSCLGTNLHITHIGRYRRTPYKINDLRCMQEVLEHYSGIKHTHRTGAWIHCQGVAGRGKDNRGKKVL